MFRRIAALNVRELAGICVVFLKRPFYLLPTYKATNKTVEISDRLYGDLHHDDNRTNAFRHALWNFLICKNCLLVARSPEKAAGWSKKITDLHERLAPNEELAKMMDLHNNRIGREMFLKSPEEEIDIVPIFQKMTMEAVKVLRVEQIEKEKDKLVFIERLKNPL